MEQKAWVDFKFITFNGNTLAFALGAIVIMFVRTFLPIMLLMLVVPVAYLFAWKYLSKKFLKIEVEP